MSRNVDVLIVGGGIYGAAATYESARRGLSTMLVERADFGSGTSANSLKIIHGGLRYLQSLDIRRSLHSIDERRRLLLLAPDVVKPLRCRLDSSGQKATHLALLGAGLAVNEVLSAHRNRGVPPTHHLPAARYPVWYDAIAEDTEELLLAFLLTARRLGGDGCSLHNYAEVTEWIREGGRVVGAVVPGVGDVRARSVIRCVGVHRPGTPVGVSLNLVVDTPPVTDRREAVALRHPTDGRNAFVVPWRDVTMVGTYDRGYDGDPAKPMEFDPEWVEEVIGWLRPVHENFRELDRRQVRFVHAGLLPLERAGSRTLKRHYSVTRSEEGVVEVAGVKYTAAYGVAQKAVDLAAATLGAPNPGEPEALVNVGALVDDFTRADPVWQRPLGDTDRRVGEIGFAMIEGGAKTLSDVLLRRTGIANAGHPGKDVVFEAAAVMEAHLGWSRVERDRQVDAFEREFHFAGNVR